MDFAIRAYRDEDAYAVPNLLRNCLHADPMTNEDFLRRVVLDPNFSPEGGIVAEAEQGVVGFVNAVSRRVPLENAPDDSQRGYITLLAANPTRRGIGSKLLVEAESFLRTRGHREVWIAPYAPGYLIPGVDVNAYPAALQFLAFHGYSEVYRPLAMETSLWDKPLSQFDPGTQPGLYCGPFGPKLARRLLDFVSEQFPGDWVRVVRSAMGDAPERLFVAVRTADDATKEVVGFSHYDRERFGPIGVSASMRGRGIGHTLMVMTLEAQRAAGYRTSWFMWSDDRTAARLYEAAGFREVRRFAVLKKTLT